MPLNIKKYKLYVVFSIYFTYLLYSIKSINVDMLIFFYIFLLYEHIINIQAIVFTD